MRNTWKQLFRLWLIGIALGVSTPAQAASGTGPYYAVPSWDQKLLCSAAANCPRFIVLTDWANQAVLDRETGLVWQQALADGTSIWTEAHAICNNTLTGGRAGWRLPTIQELASLIDTGASP